MVSAPSKSRLVVGSFFAVLIGWLVAIVLLGSAYMFDYIHHHDEASWNRLWIMPLWFSVAIWMFALPVWLIVLLPLSLFLPRSSPLWRLPICTACGAIAGALVVALVFPFPAQGIALQIWFPYTLGAVVGGVTCLAGSLIRGRMEQPRTI
jgi:hypothetical protein